MSRPASRTALMIAAGCVLCVGVPGRADAGTPPASPCGILVQTESPPGSPFTAVTGPSGLTVTEPAGLGTAAAFFQTRFTVAGDFRASVAASRHMLGDAYLGIAVGLPGAGGRALQDIFFNARDAITSNVFTAGTPVQTDGRTVKARQDATEFWLSRTGNSIAAGYVRDGVPVTVNTSPAAGPYGVPVAVTVFLIEAGTDQAAHQGVLSRLRIVAGGHETRCW